MPASPPPSVPADRSSGRRLLAREIGAQRGRVVAGTSLVIAWQLCETLVPVLIGVVVDEAIATGSVPRLLLWLGVLAATMIGLSLSFRFGFALVVRAAENVAHALRMRVAGHALHPRGVDSDLLPGEVLSLATADAEQAARVVRQLALALASLVGLLVTAVYVLSVDTALGLLILLGVPAVLVFVQALTPLVGRRAGVQQERTAAVAGLSADLLAGLRPLKGIGGEAHALTRYREASRRAQVATVSEARSWGYLAGLTTLLSGVLLAVVAGVAGTKALDGDLSLGELVALVGLTQFVAEPLTALGGLSAQLARSLACSRRIAGFLAAPHVLADGDAVLPEAELALRLSDVDAGPVRGLNLDVEPGWVVALVADDAAVGTALMDVLAGSARPESGRVTLGGIDLDRLSLAARHTALLVNPHHTDVEDGHVRDVVDPDGELDDAQVERVVAAVAGHDVAAARAEGGSGLSGGQRQRLALARALARRSPVLVLHDPTTAVDAVTEQAVAAGIADVRGAAEHATLVLTSSPALLAAAHHVVVVRGGTVTARGTHAELLSDLGYRELVLR